MSLLRHALPMALLCCFTLGCYDVVPEKDQFGSKATDTGSSDAQGNVDTGGTDGASSGGGSDGGSDAAGDATGKDTSGSCSTAKDCPDPEDSCSFYECVDSACKLKSRPDDTACSNGDACTIDDKCEAGKCVEGDFICECKTSDDCNKKHEDDACKYYFCDVSGDKPKCVVNPVQSIICPDPEEGSCVLSYACDGATGECEPTYKAANVGNGDTSCDDADPCTDKDQCKDGECKGPVKTCGCTTDAECETKNGCAGQYYCDTLASSPTCALIPGTGTPCDTSKDTPCSQTTCNVSSGKCEAKVSGENTACNDDDPCTEEGTCKSGQCVLGANKCQCTVDADCAKFEDGILCNGTLFCDKSGKAPECKVNPATVVTCDQSKNTECLENTCQDKTGKCALVPTKQAYKPCNADDNACTKNDFCDPEGNCVADENTCGCDPKDPKSCDDKDDGKPCNGTVYCDPADLTCKNKPGTKVVCADDGNVCTVEACDETTGKCVTKNADENTVCDDQTICQQAKCVKGKCEIGVDNCPCTKDSDCADKEDGDLCNGTLFCDKSGGKGECKVNPATVKTCKSVVGGKDSCAAEVCNPLTGQCVVTANPDACDDKNPCTTDICDNKKATCGSIAVPDGTACGTGKACNAGACVEQPEGMVLVAAGKGWMGCTTNDYGTCKSESLPAFEVELSAFFIDRHEVRVSEYAAFLAKEPTIGAPGTADNACNWKAKAQRLNHPVNCVTWKQADEYCKAQGKRLPTEAEWERAARGGCDVAKGSCKKGTRVFPWGNSPPSCFWAVIHGKQGKGCDTGFTRAVGTYVKDRSPYGALDMGGNVGEWVLDEWDPNGLGALKTKGKDPKNDSGGAKDHTARGGHIAAKPGEVSAFTRVKGAVGETVGFRCVKELKP